MAMGFSLADHCTIMTNPPLIYDTAIIGGGLAGLALAIQLARKHYQVLLLEKERYPFHKVCGEYVSLESRDFLTGLGVPLDEWQLPQINRVIISAPNGRSLEETLPLGGFGISRFKLDAALAGIAKQAGVQVCENAKAMDVLLEEDQFRISSSAGSFRARTVCGCFGKRSNLDVKWKRSFIYSSRKKNYTGVKYHVRADFPENRIVLHNFSGGYCGISKIENGLYCLCYLTRGVNLKKSGQSIPNLEQGILWRNPLLREAFSRVNTVYAQPLTISQISFARKTQVERHMLLVGDAAGMITPLCGNGMSMALHGSKIAAQCLDRFLQQACTRGEMEADYRRCWKQAFAARLRAGRFLQYFFGSAWLCTLLISMLKPFPALVRRLIRETHGEAF
jgi:flavin-dependent dehydrogenase